MDNEKRKSILAHLARKSEMNTSALAAIRKESAKITAALKCEIQYDNIVNNLELLNAISFRVYEEAVEAIRDLLTRLENLELKYPEIPGFTAERSRKYQNNYTLMVKALEILESIRYHQLSDIIDIFFYYSCHDNESVSKQALNGIKEISEYDLHIFYGNGKDWHGLGSWPQEKIIEKIASLDKAQRVKYFSAIIIACQHILSPTISGTSSTYNTVTWSTGALPAIDGIKQVRKKALYELQNLYNFAIKTGQKRAILNAMDEATRIPHTGKYGDDVVEMITENSIFVIEFMKSIVDFKDMEFMQKIEHDAYWLLYHRGALNETIRRVALEIRDALYANDEYKKFRILIGFESIFHDWEKGERESDDYEREEKFRVTESLKLAESINLYSYSEWKDRIIQYANIRSDDLATFPYFGKFLEHFGKTSPDLALEILSDNSDQLANFIISILCGIAESERKGEVSSLIERWCNEGKYLFSLARFYEYSPELNEKMLKKIFDKSVGNNDLSTLNQIISSASAKYEKENKHLIKNFIIPAIEELTKYKNSSWIFSVWYRRQRYSILRDMEVDEHKIILDNLFWLHDIDYHAEEILCVIAKYSPELVVQFFCNRLSKEKDEEDTGRYDAIPFRFHKLSKILSQYPEQAIKAVLSIYDGNYGLFSFRGARFLKNTFPDFPPEFQKKLIEISQSKDEKDLLFVMAILRNYEGKTIIHDVCKEIIKILPDTSNLADELSVIMQSTGVVSGEYGFVQAYQNKIEDLKSWLKDENSRVREFAQKYIASLEKRIEHERKRADEDIILRKHEYGEGED